MIARQETSIAGPPLAPFRLPLNALEGRVLFTILDILAPILIIIALGWLLARTGFFSARGLAEMNRLTYWVGLPAVLFHRIAQASLELAAVAGLLWVTIGATLIAVVAAVLVVTATGMPRAARGAFVQGVFRGNLAFIGLPVVLYAFAGSGQSSAEAAALLAFGPLVVIYNVLAVLVMLVYGTDKGDALQRLPLGLATNPILLACLAGMAMAYSGWTFPTLVDRTLGAVGQMALPLALLLIGGTLYHTRLQGSVARAVLGSAMKVTLVPAIGLVLAWALALPEEHTRIALLLLACPTASASYVLVRQFDGDAALASSMIVISNLLAVPALVLVLVLTA